MTIGMSSCPLCWEKTCDCSEEEIASFLSREREMKKDPVYKSIWRHHRKGFNHKKTIKLLAKNTRNAVEQIAIGILNKS